MAAENFIDYVKLFLRSGAGGPGSRHFFRAKGVPNGGPDGGDGGKGGDIVMQANSQLWTLLHLKYTKHLHADDGKTGSSSNKTGADGNGVLIEVPVGTVIRNAETGEVSGEVKQDGDRLVVIKGGRGGMGNTHFKTSTNQAPDYAQPGEPNIEGWFILELKLLADVGLVGFPNAGKSTLLSSISAARPKIADYPFTTLTPNLGVVAYREYKSFVVADIPGIIEGASEGKGIGLRFLRHIERNSCLLYLIAADSDDFIKEYEILQHELKEHNPDLLNKKSIIAVSKIDLADESTAAKLLELRQKYGSVITFSSATGENLQQLKDALWQTLHAANTF